MMVMFGERSMTGSLAALRYYLLTKKIVSATSFVTPERLPPTQSSTKYHCFRTYYQTMTWMGMTATDIDPVIWGWKLLDQRFLTWWSADRRRSAELWPPVREAPARIFSFLN